jgi:hypothetical protein
MQGRQRRVLNAKLQQAGYPVLLLLLTMLPMGVVFLLNPPPFPDSFEPRQALHFINSTTTYYDLYVGFPESDYRQHITPSPGQTANVWVPTRRLEQTERVRLLGHHGDGSIAFCWEQSPQAWAAFGWHVVIDQSAVDRGIRDCVNPTPPSHAAPPRTPNPRR